MFLLLYLFVAAVPGQAATGSLYAAGNISLPDGIVSMGTNMWVADHALGVCRLDLGFAPGNITPYGINQTTCNVSALSPGQVAFDSAHNFLYVPDNASKGLGVYRVPFDSAANALRAGTLLPNINIKNNRATAVALSPNGNLYVVLGRNNNILRITNPGTTPSVPTIIGKALDRKGPASIAFVGPDLYLGEAVGVTKIANADGCSNCTAVRVNAITVTPAFITSGATNLYVANLSEVWRFYPDQTCPGGLGQELYVSTTTTGFQNISALGLGAGNLYVGDDTTVGVSLLTGRVWQVGLGLAPEAAGICTGGTPPPPPPPGPAATTGTLHAAGNVTMPEGLVWMGSHLWTGDHGLGVCRLDPSTTPTVAPYSINQNTCNASAFSPGQMAFDSVNIYVPDNASKGQGVWRLKFNAANETVGSPVLLANGGGGTGGNRASAVALGPDGKLYVVFGKNNNILRITNPGCTTPCTQLVENVGKTLDTRTGPPAIAFVGYDLYLAEAAGVTRIPMVHNCGNGSCTAATVPALSGVNGVAAPTFIIADTTTDAANPRLYISDLNNVVYRFNLTSGVLDRYATGGTDPAGIPQAFQNITALGVAPDGTLYVGDDSTAGTLLLFGRVFKEVFVP